MTFDPHSLERLRELGRQLPQTLPTPEPISRKKKQTSNKPHRIETEQDPKKLFHELMNASTDGTVPSHLINRLKEAEAKQTAKENDYSLKPQTKLHPQYPYSSKSTSSQSPGRARSKDIEEEESLYIAFKALLLENDI